MAKKTLRERIRLLKRDVKALTLALKDRRVGWAARLVILIAVGYALSPIDLIPDFIPVLGLLDDLVILPALIFLAVKLVPPGLIEEYRIRSETETVSTRAKWVAAIFIGAVWAALLGAVAVWIVGLIRR